MKRDDCIIMYDKMGHDNENKRIIRCFACIGRSSNENLCSFLYHEKALDEQFYFSCGIQGYNTSAVRHLYDVFDNKVNKILMTTEQCFLCDRNCRYPMTNCILRNNEITDTIKYYKEVVGIS